MLFLFVALTAQILYSLSFVGDKFVIEKTVRHASVLTFFINLFGALGVLFWIFDPRLPTITEVGLGIFSGAMFSVSTYYYFLALSFDAASKVTPMFGGVSAAATVAISFLLGEKFGPVAGFGILLLTVSIFLFAKIGIAPGGVAPEKTKKYVKLIIFLSGISMALSVVSFKELTASAGFFIGFSVARLGALVSTLPMLLSPAFLKNLRAERIARRSRVDWSALSGRFFGAGGNILSAYAVSIGSASVIQALQGVQYVLIIPLMFLFSKKFPGVFKEAFGRQTFAARAAATAFVVAGLILISIKK